MLASGLNLHGWVPDSVSLVTPPSTTAPTHIPEREKNIFILLFVYNILKLLYLLLIIKNISH